MNTNVIHNIFALIVAWMYKPIESVISLCAYVKNNYVEKIENIQSKHMLSKWSNGGGG